MQHRRIGRISEQLLVASTWALTSVSAVPRSAGACGSVVPPTYTLTRVWPADGAVGLPRDTAVVVEGFASSARGGPGWPVEVTVLDAETGEPIAGSTTSGFSELDPPRASWVAAAPLEARHGYEVQVSVENPDGQAMARSRFETGDAFLPPLELSGELRISVGGGEADVLGCGGCGCAPARPRRALHAMVELPRVVGGQAWGAHYESLLFLTKDVPAPVFGADGEPLPLWGDPGALWITPVLAPTGDAALVIEQEIVPLELEYAPCFTFVVRDAAGHFVDASACLPTLTPGQVRGLAVTDETLSAESLAERVRDAEDDAAGCALGATPARAGLATLIPVGFALAGAARRRSVTRRARAGQR